MRLCDELDNTTSLLDLALGILGEVTGADDEWDVWKAALSEDLAVAEWEEVEDWSGVLAGTGGVLLALLERDERPELGGLSVSIRDHLFGEVLLPYRG